MCGPVDSCSTVAPQVLSIDHVIFDHVLDLGTVALQVLCIDHMIFSHVQHLEAVAPQVLGIDHAICGYVGASPHPSLGAGDVRVSSCRQPHARARLPYWGDLGDVKKEGLLTTRGSDVPACRGLWVARIKNYEREAIQPFRKLHNHSGSYTTIQEATLPIENMNVTSKLTESQMERILQDGYS
ncbi:hypothetical protein RRG08_038326 [Elysia crispata]|uniref:Uncharacterized protein n=1 Tax=Elysia crispata TaxID=231223 RepID=A0AAE1APE3_9GAST|nr:hypothetical protein RRG08_038326 [Elysia crispata]